MARIVGIHAEWLKEPKYRQAYEELEEEFVLALAAMTCGTAPALPKRSNAAERSRNVVGEVRFVRSSREKQ
jgi:hypothetical protein